MNIIFISNGHGEDVIASQIINELSSIIEDASISAFPIVGEGRAFRNKNVKILGTQKSFPSGGFTHLSASNFIKDISFGLFSNLISQIKIFVSLRNKFDLAVSIGDIVPIIAALLLNAKFIFIGCAKSDYYKRSYTALEKYLLRKYCTLCFARDKITSENLNREGIKSLYVGNPMMDCITIGEKIKFLKPNSKIIGILPGSRNDAYKNIEDIGKIIRELNEIAGREKIDIEFIAAVSENLDLSKLPIIRNLHFFKDRFREVINESDMIIGLSGTANEQAAGLGKPVVSFAGRGSQYTELFAKRQKQLLGDALLVSNISRASLDIWTLLFDADRRRIMSNAGQERMGKSGASKEIAKIIKNENWI